jgi:RHH-type proline utilization regulon transcriptional repressor/proline dehydrogenase/delta 1-pyrroline-5-carboxylate dehydrogenase
MFLPNPYRPESSVLSHRLAALEGALDWSAVVTASAPWVQAVRDNPPPFWAMESLLKEYPISSAEGLALMRLAEALLRVPDAETAMALTADQLGRADFDGGEHAGPDGQPDGISRSTLARLSSSAIALSKKFLPEAGEQPGLFVRLGARTVVAATLRSVQLLGRQFVLGQTIADAQKEATSARKKQPGLRFSYDMLGEGARTEADAQAYLASYTHAIRSIAEKSISTSDRGQNCAENDGISIKLSALHPRYEDAQTQRVMAELVPRVWGLCQLAAQANINLTIDAEEVDRLELSLQVFEALAQRVATEYPQWSGFGLALQAYQTRALELVAHVIGVARRLNIRLMCRLVKGAYWDAEIKRAQELGLPHYPVFTEKHHTDVSYLACARALLAAPDAIYPQFATHNAGTIAAILQMAGMKAPTLASSGAALPPEGADSPWGGPAANRAVNCFELQRLHGMGEGIYREVLKHPAVRCRVYAPVGQHRDLLAYLVRRLLENGANSSFVHQLADESVGMDVLLASPMAQAQGFERSRLPMPPDIYGPARRNSQGLDLAVAEYRAPLLAAFDAAQVPVVTEFNANNALSAYQACADSYQQWSNTPVEQRAAALRRAADALEADMPRFCALLVKEAHKTWGDTVAEVREAVDFLRYYANEAERIMQPIALPQVDAVHTVSPPGRPKAEQPHSMGGTGAAQAWGHDFQWGVTGETNTLRLTARGVWVAISPWNFPLAIFLGQVAAALATGNTVLAKPAEQTPGVALAAVHLLHAAGVPADAVQLIHGPGETVGAALVALPGVAGVVFTGSTQVAKLIQRALAAKDGPIVPLIAETGGLNAMLVDSTALPEQVADAVVQSAFRSAGQRCSALRLLCVHEAVADGMLHMIAGAAQELCVGNPAELATDVGPLIDAEAFEGISRQVVRLKKESKPLLSLDGIDLSAMPNLMPPQMFEVADIGAVGEEIFGPVLQVLRWGPGCAGLETPDAVVRAINALGYGLTFGIQTRIDSRAQALAGAAHIGNVYVNRNMIGAVVGLQPFGGEGLSGTGPKAGGPHYLYRFCAEQTVTINTTAAGGNVALLASVP